MGWRRGQGAAPFPLPNLFTLHRASAPSTCAPHPAPALHPFLVTRGRSSGGDGSLPRNPIQILQPAQHVARLGSIRRPEYSRQVQLVDYSRRSPISNLETPLQQRRAPSLILYAALRCLAEQLVAISLFRVAVPSAAGLQRFLRAHLLEDVFLARRLRDRHEPLGFHRGLPCRSPLAVPAHQAFRVFI